MALAANVTYQPQLTYQPLSRLVTSGALPFAYRYNALEQLRFPCGEPAGSAPTTRFVHDI